MNDNKRIRSMRLEDIERILEIENRCYPEPWTEGMFKHELTGNQVSVFFVLEESGVIIGYAGMWIIVDDMHVTNVAVHPDFQGNGHSKQLMFALFEQARMAGCKRSTLEVRKSNKTAISLYEKLGYKTIGRRKKYYSNNEDAFVMWLDGIEGISLPVIPVEYVEFVKI